MAITIPRSMRQYESGWDAAESGVQRDPNKPKLWREGWDDQRAAQWDADQEPGTPTDWDLIRRKMEKRSERDRPLDAESA